MRMHQWALAWVPLLMATMASHAATPVVESSLTISNFGYRLIDLDPDDGVTPWIEFAPTSMVGIAAIDDPMGPTPDNFNFLPGTVFSAADAEFSTANGSARASNTSSLKAFRVSADDTLFENGQFPTLIAGMVQVYGSGSTQDSLIPYPLEGDYGFLLSPNTAIVVEGTVDVSNTINAGALNGTSFDDALSQLESAYAVVSSGTYAYLTFSIEDGFMQEIPYAYDVELNIYAELIAGGSWDLQEAQKSESMQFAFYNESTEARAANFKIEMATYMEGHLYSFIPDTEVPPVPAIPEPSTVALMLLGMGGLGAAARRHKVGV